MPHSDQHQHVVAAVGLGGNLGDTPATLIFALQQLALDSHIQLLAISPLYRSAPLGPPGQPDYANAVVMLRTARSAEDLLDTLQTIEQRAGRERSIRWGSRTLDLDLLLYGDVMLNSPRLTIPHVELAHRAFVLLPLFDVLPSCVLPDGTALINLVNACSRDGIAAWSDTRWPTSIHQITPT